MHNGIGSSITWPRVQLFDIYSYLTYLCCRKLFQILIPIHSSMLFMFDFQFYFASALTFLHIRFMFLSRNALIVQITLSVDIRISNNYIYILLHFANFSSFHKWNLYKMESTMFIELYLLKLGIMK